MLHGVRLVLATLAVSAAGFMNVLDTTIAVVSLPTIAGNLAATPSQGSWVITSYGVCLAVVLPLSGSLLVPSRQMTMFRGPATGSAPAEEMHELVAATRLFDQLIAGLPRKGLEIAHGTRIGGHDLQHVAALHVGQCLFGLQDRQWAVQSAGVEFSLGLHGMQGWSAGHSTGAGAAKRAASLRSSGPMAAFGSAPSCGSGSRSVR